MQKNSKIYKKKLKKLTKNIQKVQKLTKKKIAKRKQ